MAHYRKVVKIKEIHSGEILFEATMEELGRAYEYASELEKMGLEVEVIAPTLTQSLVDNLGLTLDEKEEYEQSVFDEIHDHDGSCCAGLEEGKKDS